MQIDPGNPDRQYSCRDAHHIHRPVWLSMCAAMRTNRMGYTMHYSLLPTRLPRHHRGRAALAAACVLTVSALAFASGSATAGTSSGYVALGDSYTAGFGVQPAAAGAPLDCVQSAANYPHLTAQAKGLTLTDVSCSGATVQNMTTAQYLDQPPQFNALTSDTSVVTLGIGGNDHNVFADAIAACYSADTFAAPIDLGSPCKDMYGSTFSDAITSDAPNIAAAIKQIHKLSPKAKVFVVGYLDVVPQSGSCYPQIPLTTGDTAYVNGIEQNLNSMLRTQAQANGATFVDAFGPSIGHDACQSSTVRWVDPGSGTTSPIHPNTAGEAAYSRLVESAFSTAGI
ncbi:SGNH/GDSL hydrolase family protein [Nocardia niigatensis]|uniref:SGNH/GDSL hydrolase family protein n=1 Tax=Nocardia niigatensis TaxID=209249 RepID=UPI0012F6C851|nr:SGNH/GDSL hydrolase family protein [Nocardia niigatensis]